MAKFRKKPVVIDAVQFTGDDITAKKVLNWVGDGAGIIDTDHIQHLWDYDIGAYVLPSGKVIFAPYETHCLIVLTLEGEHVALPNDWIIKGVQGEFYPCKPDIFDATYEPVQEEETA